MWPTLLALLAAIIPLAILIQSLSEVYRKRVRYRHILDNWRHARTDEHGRLISEWLEQTPRCGAAWFLQGVLHLRAYRTRQAARAFGMSHHADCRLESAALLTFACLKATQGKPSDILVQIDNTWAEMNRPALGSSYEERLILETLEADTPEAPPLPPSARLAWLVVGPAQRAQLSDVAMSAIATDQGRIGDEKHSN